MPFIGNQPALSYTSFAVQHFTTSATTSYTLDHSVANENEIRLVINNVVQQPGSSYAYTASGTTLTLSAATSATDTMYAVFLGKAVQTVTPASGSVTNAMIVDGTIAENKLASGVNTITEADMFALTTDLVNPGTSDITANLERVSVSTFAKIGTGMTESSGIFTFPSNGLYWIITACMLKVTSDTNANVRTYISSDGGSNYTQSATMEGGNASSSENTTSVYNHLFVNVTNSSNFRVKFQTGSMVGATIRGSANLSESTFTFIRLGDSV